jgi:NADPH:quinone reductase-like Zn-dependent oxidoreductase
MKAYQIGAQKGLDSLTLVDRPDPTPGPGEVVVAVRAASLNHRDLNILGASYGPPKPETRIPLSDGAGDVVAVGPGVTSAKAGDRVTATHFTRWTDGAFDPAYFGSDLGVTADGWLAEKALIPAQALVPIPEGMSYREAASLPVAAVTAWSVIETFGRVTAGETVLVLGTGGVSIFGLQIARIAGARVAVTSSSDDKLAACRKLGAEIVVNYKTTPDWDKAVLAATGGRGVDIVVETGGIATLAKSLACTAANGRVGLIGGLGGRAEGTPNLMPLVAKNIVLKGITSGSRRAFADLMRAFGANAVKPVIDKVFPFAEAGAAFRYLDGGGHVGKVLIARD